MLWTVLAAVALIMGGLSLTLMALMGLAHLYALGLRLSRAGVVVVTVMLAVSYGLVRLAEAVLV